MRALYQKHGILNDSLRSMVENDPLITLYGRQRWRW